MKLSRREQKILLYAGGVLIVALVWILVYQKAQERNMVLAQENMELQNELNVLRKLEVNEKRYKKEIKSMNKEIAEIYEGFPAEIKEETVIMFGCDLEENAQVHINNINIAPRNLAYGVEPNTKKAPEKAEKTTEKTEETPKKTEATVEADSKSKTGKGMYLYNTNVDYQFQVTYEGIKKTTEYIFGDENKRAIRSLALAYDEGTGNLLGSLKVDFYGVEGTKKRYEEPWVPSMPLGEKNIFGTVNQMEEKNP